MKLNNIIRVTYVNFKIIARVPLEQVRSLKTSFVFPTKFTRRYCKFVIDDERDRVEGLTDFFGQCLVQIM